jgi:hypothetical protein
MKKDLSQQDMQAVRGGAAPLWVSLLKTQTNSNINRTKAAWESDLWCKQHSDDSHCRPKPVKPMPPMQTMRYPSDSDSDKVTF